MCIPPQAGSAPAISKEITEALLAAIWTSEAPCGTVKAIPLRGLQGQGPLDCRHWARLRGGYARARRRQHEAGNGIGGDALTLRGRLMKFL
jgi:hypothetical protein